MLSYRGKRFKILVMMEGSCTPYVLVVFLLKKVITLSAQVEGYHLISLEIAPRFLSK